jgi:hypothetical protein
VAEHGHRDGDRRSCKRWKMVSLDIAPGGVSGRDRQPQATAMVEHLRAHGTRQACNASTHRPFPLAVDRR